MKNLIITIGLILLFLMLNGFQIFFNNMTLEHMRGSGWTEDEAVIEKSFLQRVSLYNKE